MASPGEAKERRLIQQCRPEELQELGQGRPPQAPSLEKGRLPHHSGRLLVRLDRIGTLRAEALSPTSSAQVHPYHFMSRHSGRTPLLWGRGLFDRLGPESLAWEIPQGG